MMASGGDEVHCQVKSEAGTILQCVDELEASSDAESTTDSTEGTSDSSEDMSVKSSGTAYEEGKGQLSFEHERIRSHDSVVEEKSIYELLDGKYSPVKLKKKAPFTGNEFMHLCAIIPFCTYYLFVQGLTEVERIYQNICEHNRVLIILRGAPGSGKSYLAKQFPGFPKVFSSDEYFMVRGCYCFDPKNVPHAHVWNQARAYSAISAGESPIIIDNTNTQVWEMLPYIKMGVDHHYFIEIVEPNTPWKSNPIELMKRTEHSVPLGAIKLMLLRYEDCNTIYLMLKKHLSDCVILKSNCVQEMPSSKEEFNKFKLTKKESSQSVDGNQEIELGRKISDVDPRSTSLSNLPYSSLSDVKSGPSKVDTPSKSVDQILQNCKNESFDSSHSETQPTAEQSFRSRSSSSENVLLSNTEDSYDGCFREKPKPQRKHTAFRLISEKMYPNVDEGEVMKREENELQVWDDVKVDNNVNESENKIEERTKPKPRRTVAENLKASILVDSSCENKNIHPQNQFAGKNKSELKSPKCRRNLFLGTTNFLEGDWAFPPLDSSLKFPTSVENEEVKTTSMSCTSAQTDTSDFILSHKVYNSLDIECVYPTLAPKMNPCERKEAVGSTMSSPSHLAVGKMHRYTSTENLCDLDIFEKLDKLKEMFPNVPVNILEYYLEICCYDVSRSINELIDGYDYICTNVKLPAVDNCLLDRKTNEDADDAENCQAPTLDFIAPNKKKLMTETPDSPVDPKQLMKKMNLTLPPEFAFQLKEVFGQVSIDISLETNRQIEIDVEFAELLYKKWMNSILEKSGKPDAKKEDQVKKTKKEKKKKKQNKADPSALASTVKRRLFQDEKQPIIADPCEPGSLKEIMDREFALNIQKEEKIKSDTNPRIRRDREKLYESFPGADPQYLDEVFQSLNYSLKETLEAIEFSGQNIQEEKDSFAYRVRSGSGSLEDLSKQEPADTTPKLISNHYLDWVYPEARFPTPMQVLAQMHAPYQLFSPGKPASEALVHAQKLRAKAAELFECQLQNRESAAHAYQYGEKQAAPYYAIESAEYRKKFAETQKEAASLIFEDKNKDLPSNVIDLHGLHVKEAITALDKFIKKQKEISKEAISLFRSYKFTVITGRGKHSENGPRLKPSVVEFLAKGHYSFCDLNSGSIQVSLV